MRKMPMRSAISAETVPALSDAQIFDTLAVRLDGPRAQGQQIKLNWVFADSGKRYLLEIDNGVMHAQPASAIVAGAPAVSTSRPAIDAIVCGQQTFEGAITSGGIAGDGVEQLRTIVALLEPIARMFEIVEPRRG